MNGNLISRVYHRPLKKDPNAVPVPAQMVREMGVKPEKASPFTKFGRLKHELGRWYRAGHKIVPKEIRKQRLAICKACEYFNPQGNLGLGECQYPGCGCTKAKLFLATSICPHQPPKWPAYEPNGN